MTLSKFFPGNPLWRKVMALGVIAGAAAGSAVHAQTIKVGVTAGPHAQVMEEVKKVAGQDGLTIEILEFSDYVQPNAALAAGDLHANSYQHQPYLDAQVQDRGYPFTSVATTVVFPIGIYSNKVKNLADLRTGAKFGIPNDPTNGGRVLLLLESLGLIRIKDGAGLKATPLDVVENPKKLDFVELDAAQLPRSLNDLDASAVNTNFAMSSGLNPKEDSIAMEAADSPYANILVIRTADKDQPWVGKLVKAYHSPTVRRFIDEAFKGSVVAAF